jgi:S1-C subfamily serine protease
MQSRDAQFGDSQQSRDTQRQFGDNRQTNVNVGIQFGAVTDRGLTVTSIERNSVFATSGLVQGDVIISVGGRPVRSQVEFVQFISVRRGEPIPVVVFRNGREETIHITYDASLIAPQGPANVGAAGANLLGVTFDTQVQNAAVVLHVVPGGPAATVGIKPGDEIVAINGQRINGHQQANQIVGAMRPGDQVEIQYLQLQQAQIVLGGPNVPRTAAAAGEVRVDQNVQRSNYQPEIQVQTNQGQNARLEGNVNRDTRQQPQSSGNQDQRPRNRSLLPRIRN